ncbi:hypothetical protein [Neisseria wadsworthii]|uniref:hypothetical protein n=1 Tax=Neisseria wadsworthii TaxID=607711 RepID=UPI00131E294B|nr:hypothetical protein [Neisseria wadsworthii]
MDFKKFKSRILETVCLESKYEDKIIEDYLNELQMMIQEFIESKLCVKDIFYRLFNTIGKPDYIHHACEFSLAYHFFKTFPDRFSYQISSQVASTGNIADHPKNYDIKFSNKNLNFHVEVKTITPMNYESKEPCKIFLPDDERQSIYEQGFKDFSPNLVPKISRFLKDANMQLPLRQSSNDINIVMLCCNNLDEYADILECLCNERMGILSEQNKGSNIVPAKKDLCNIDGIVICNLRFEHYAFFDREKLFKFYQCDDVCLSGKEVWQYYRSTPVLPILFFLKNFEEDVEKTMSSSFFSHTGYFADYWKKSNSDNQTALFSLFNDIANKKI